MNRLLLSVLALAVAVTFSAPAFAEDKKEEKKDKKGHFSTVFAEKKDEKKKDEKGK